MGVIGGATAAATADRSVMLMRVILCRMAAAASAGKCHASVQGDLFHFYAPCRFVEGAVPDDTD
jgi:hypothetical protein